jgi:hypothetical protein
VKFTDGKLKPIEASEGWQAFLTPGARVAHYIREQTSLCRKIGFYTSELVPHVAGNPKGNDDCSECHRKIERELKKAGKKTFYPALAETRPGSAK